MASIKSFRVNDITQRPSAHIGAHMATIIKEVNIAKETDDVLAAFVLVIKDIKAGKNALEIGSDALPALISAVSGIDQVPAELADRKLALDTILLRVSEIVSVLLAPSVKAVAEAAVAEAVAAEAEKLTE